MTNDHLLLLGEIKGRLDHIQNDQVVLIRKIDAIDGRLRTVETRSAINGAVTGGVMAVGIALIKSALTGA
ncbi:hypothetical protein [Thiocystis violascens]|uniref:Uncharacterized protein n=1 Tax=Thiocystis violascens (strain ATCC 17096 / DSM 198 / 6111) TaxID=765911 RepID=I3YGV2_THIV6|nr:hypothetical protein [Thiocystis violascens]AFL76220.1 hypothetical protein Thivi_4417 [Thiocystis violascens DSM 198]